MKTWFKLSTFFAFGLGFSASLVGSSLNAEPAPKLPIAPYDYRVTLPAHLQSVPQITSNSAGNLRSDTTIHDNNLATLGRVLFYDTSLSANNLVSCASCHKQANGFDDPTPFSIGFKGLITKRSAMGLTNARFNANGRYFWDERATSLKHQSLQPFFDPIEMGLKQGELVARVKAKPYYLALFEKAFTDPNMNQENIATALAQFILSITATGTLYDNERAKVIGPLSKFSGFTVQQSRGKFLFFSPPQSGGAGCNACHQTDAFISPANGANNGIDANSGLDQGVGAINQSTKNAGNFRPPSLLNIAARAPYMHDGRFESLTDVINHYSNGIKNHPNLGKPLKNEKGGPRKFNFSAQDKAALIAFLETLSDEKTLTDPKFSNPFN